MGGVDVDDRLRDRDEVDVVGRRGEVRGAMVRDGDLAGLVELDADAGRSRRPTRQPRASGRRRGRRSPAAGCTGRTGRRRSTPSSPIRPPRLRSGYVSCGPEPNQRSVSWPGRELEHGADARQVVERRPGSPRTRRPRARRRGAACTSPRAAPRCRLRSCRRCGRPSRAPRRSTPTRRRSRRSTPGLRPARRHPADAVVVGRGAPEREGRWRGEGRVAEEAVVVERQGGVRVGGGLGHGDRRFVLPERQLNGTDLEAVRRPVRRLGRGDPDGQELFARRRPPAAHPGRSTIARSPGPSAGRSNAPPAISMPSAVNE